ncbi:MAG TPA: response regulator transcription factor [Chitinophagaceae bacterium]|nr:response regulator transcription factor [Chitinophagaceae bacterium]
MIRVVIFEDNAQLRETMFKLIDGSEGFTCSGAFANCKDVLAKIEATHPDVILMDIQMPVISGIEAVKLIKQEFPQMKILMQTVFEDDDNVFQSICNGAEGYVLKNKPVEQILESIKDIHEGGAPMSPAIALKVIRMFKKNFSADADDSFSLSVREKEILKCLVEGMSYKMIADNCFITLETVGGHIKNIYKKLQVHSKSEAVVKAIKGKIV